MDGSAVPGAGDNDERLPPVRASFYLNGALAHVADIAGGTGSIPTQVDEGSLATSANAAVPADVVQAGLEMVVEVDPDGTLDGGLGVARRFPETGRAAVDVRAVPLLEITLVPVLWTQNPDSEVLELVGGMAADPEGHELLALMRTLLPVGDLDVKAHEPVFSSSNHGDDLFDQTKAIRVIEGGTGYWMGTISGTNTGPSIGRGVWSYSVPIARVIAHEFGHNFSLDFTLTETTDGDGRGSFVFALPADPAWAGNLASITLSGPAGSATLDADTAHPMTILIDPRTRQVRGILRGLSPPPRL